MLAGPSRDKKNKPGIGDPVNCLPKRITTYFLTLLMSLLKHAILGTSKPTIPKIHIDIIDLI
jgi:hypothetical protein